MLMMETEFIPADLADTVARLENWGRWAKERQKRGRARSAEGNFRSRRGNNETEEDAIELARRGSEPAIKPWDALEVGAMLATAPPNSFPMRAFILIRAKFHFGCSPSVICRLINCRSSDYGAELNKALYMARNRLTLANTHA